MSVSSVPNPTQLPVALGARLGNLIRSKEEGVQSFLLEEGSIPLKLRILNEWLTKRLRCPKAQDAKYLPDGFKLGFWIRFQGECAPYMARNLCSITGMEKVVSEKIKKKHREGRILGPFPSLPLPSLRVPLWV